MSLSLVEKKKCNLLITKRKFKILPHRQSWACKLQKDVARKDNQSRLNQEDCVPLISRQVQVYLAKK